ncbi:hypothetical protein ACHAO5_006088, partial [Verticillium nonalfalfae]
AAVTVSLLHHLYPPPLLAGNSPATSPVGLFEHKEEARGKGLPVDGLPGQSPHGDHEPRIAQHSPTHFALSDPAGPQTPGPQTLDGSLQEGASHVSPKASPLAAPYTD